MNVIKANEVNVLNLGRQGEHLRTAIEFDYSDLAKEFPGGAAVLRVRMPDAEETYIEANVEYDFDKNSFVWTVTEHDTAYEGIGSCQMIYSWEGRAKSKVWKTYTGENVMHSEIAPPEWEELIDMLSDLAAETVANADRAYHSAQDAENSAEEAAGYAEDAENQAKEAASSANFVKKAELSIIQKHAEVVTMHREVQSNRDATDANREQATAAAESASASADIATDAMERSTAIATSVGQMGFVTEQNAKSAHDSAASAESSKNAAYQYANGAESAKNYAVSSAQAVGQMQGQISQTAQQINDDKLTVEGYKNQAESFANQASQSAGQAEEIRQKYETMSVYAQTGEAGSEAQVHYFSDDNRMLFQIPKGDKGDPGDPSVTKETIHNALGFDPADEADVSQIKGDMSDLQDEVETKAEKASLAKTNRSLDALWKISEGQTYSVEEKVETGMNVAPSGAEFMSMDEVHGKSEQETTNGYNLFSPQSFVPSVNFMKNDDGTYTTKGLNGLNAFCSIELEPGTYTAGIEYAYGDALGAMYVRVDGTMNNTQEQTFSITEKTMVTIQIRAYSEQHTTFRFQLSKSASALPYEPYTGGIPSPNPDYPQEIHSVEEININVVGKNLLDVSKSTKVYVNSEGQEVASLTDETFDYIRVNSGPLTLSVVAKATNTAIPMRIAQYDESKKFIVRSMQYVDMTAGNRYSKTFALDSKAKFVRAIMNTANHGMKETMMLEQGETMTEYEPYTEQTYTITPPRPLNKIEDYVDKADVKLGKWIYKTMSLKFDGSESWRLDDGGTLLMLYPHAVEVEDAPKNGTNAISNYGIEDIRQSTQKYGTSILPNQDAIRVRSKEIVNGQTVEAFKESVSRNPIVYTMIPASGDRIEDIDSSDLEILRSLEDIPASHTIIVTDQDGNDVSYLLQYIIKLSEVN